MSKTQYFYAVVAALALVACWSQNLQYLPLGLMSGTQAFLTDLFANPASRSITYDIGFFGLAAGVWMIQDSRKSGVSHVWAYLVFGLLVAISVTFPLYLIARERKLKV